MLTLGLSWRMASTASASALPALTCGAEPLAAAVVLAGAAGSLLAAAPCGAWAQADRLIAPSTAKMMRFINRILGVLRSGSWTARRGIGSADCGTAGRASADPEPQSRGEVAMGVAALGAWLAARPSWAWGGSGAGCDCAAVTATA